MPMYVFTVIDFRKTELAWYKYAETSQYFETGIP